MRRLRGGGREEQISPLAARLYHLRKYHQHLKSELQQLQLAQQEEDTRHGPFSRKGLRHHIMSRMLILEELEETMQQLEQLVNNENTAQE